MEKAIDELKKEDQENPKDIPRSGSYDYYKSLIDRFLKDNENDVMFSHHFTTRCAVQFLVVYCDLKGLLCFKRKGKINDRDITNLVIAKDAELSEKEGMLKPDK